MGLPGADEQVLRLVEAARTIGERPGDLRRKLDAEQRVRVGCFDVERRTTELVAVRRLGPPPTDVPRWRAVADAAREDLRRAAIAGDPRARRALREIGQPAPAPRHWSEQDED